MHQRNVALLIFLCFMFLLSACPSGGSGGDSNNQEPVSQEDQPNEEEEPTTQEKIQTTSVTGSAQFELGNTQYNINVQDLDTDVPLNGIEIHGLKLDSGDIIWAQDPSGTYFPAVEFRLFNDASETETRIAVTTILFGLVAGYNIGSAIYEYYSDPPGIENILSR